MEPDSDEGTVTIVFDKNNLMRNDSFYPFKPWQWYFSLRNAKIITIEPIIFLYTFATYLFLSLSQQYYFNNYALDEFVNASDVDFIKQNGLACLNKSALEHYTGSNDTLKVVEERSTLLVVYTSLARIVPSIFTTLMLGPLSDRFGRRPVIVLAAMGGILEGIFSICVVYFNLSLYYFILSAGLCGIWGDFPAILMASFSYVSDISSTKWRTLRIGVAESMTFMAGMISSGAGGVWFKKLNCQLMFPLVLFTACHLGIILYTLLLLPESLTSEQRRIKNLEKPGGLQVLVRGLKIFFCSVGRYVNSVWKMWVAIIPLLILVINVTGHNSIGILFFKALNWDPILIGAQSTVVMGSRMLSLLVLLPILVAIQLPDPLISLIGGLINCSMNLFMGFSSQTYQFFISKLESQNLNCILYYIMKSCVCVFFISCSYPRNGLPRSSPIERNDVQTCLCGRPRYLGIC